MRSRWQTALIKSRSQVVNNKELNSLSYPTLDHPNLNAAVCQGFEIVILLIQQDRSDIELCSLQKLPVKSILSCPDHIILTSCAVI